MRTIPGHSNYLATEDGHIVSLHGKEPKLLTERGDFFGYRRVQVTRDDGVRDKARVHVLVASAFHGPRPTRRHVVRHLDGVGSNNHPSNLAWGTVKQNYMDAVNHGTRARGEAIGGRVMTPEIVAAVIGADLSVTTAEVARRAGISFASASRIRKRQRWTEYIPAGATA